MHKKYLFSIFLLAGFFIGLNPTNTEAFEPCRVGIVTITINGNCMNTVTCGEDVFWLDCCSDFGQDVGWCEN